MAYWERRHVWKTLFRLWSTLPKCEKSYIIVKNLSWSTIVFLVAPLGSSKNHQESLFLIECRVYGISNILNSLSLLNIYTTGLSVVYIFSKLTEYFLLYIQRTHVIFNRNNNCLVMAHTTYIFVQLSEYEFWVYI